MGIVYRVNGKTVSKKELNETADEGKLTEILETRQFPGVHDDTSFMANRGTLADQLGDTVGLVTEEAKKNGYTPGYNDVYLPSLADFPGDPKAFIKQDNAKGQVRKVCEDNNWSCHGSVSVESRNDEAPKETGLADDLVIPSFLEMKKSDPKIKYASKDEIRQEVNKKHHKK